MKYLLFSCLLFCTYTLSAQPEHRVAVDGKAIEFKEIDKLMIVGHDGTDLKISRGDNEGCCDDDRSKGLRKISASGKQDNTGFGLYTQRFDDRVVVEQVGKGEGRVVVSVPNNAVVHVEQSTWRGSHLKVEDFDGELDVSMAYHK
ncbi:MAG: hypothetical protein AAFZ52_16305, partial [Bacteroidota bacterium]